MTHPLDPRALEAAAIEGSDAFKAALRVLIERDPSRVPAAAVLRDAIVAYLAEAGDGWMPIESAPQNQMLLIANSGWGYVDRQIACRRDYAESGWVDQRAQPIPVAAKPTHWRPLPAHPPAEEKK
jgi:hypothetical protein